MDCNSRKNKNEIPFFKLTKVDKRLKVDKIEFSTLIILYMIGGFLGTLWETILNLIKGNGFVFVNGTIFLPFNFVYGFGAIVIILCLRKVDSIVKVFVYGAVGGGFAEYLMSFLEEHILGTRSWDYSTYFLNIDGRTTIPFMFFWGLLSVIAIYGIYSPLQKYLIKIPKSTLTYITKIIAIVIVVDLTIMILAVLRYKSRANDIKPSNPITKMIDYFFNDEYMKLHFPKMKRQEKTQINVNSSINSNISYEVYLN